MSERGGWCVDVKSSDRTFMCMVANKNREEAEELALAHVEGSRVTGGSEVWESEITALGMKPNEVRISTVLTPDWAS